MVNGQQTISIKNFVLIFKILITDVKQKSIHFYIRKMNDQLQVCVDK